MKTLALVTARGGSKGFPGKNLALLGDRPLVGWSHELLASFRSRHGDTRLFLSTDCPKIASAWPQEDRPGRLRPAHLASDTASSLDVVDYELAQAEVEGFSAAALLLVQPTSPLLALEDLEAAWSLLNQGAPCVVGMVPLDHPIQWTWSRNLEGLLHPLIESNDETRRQDLPQGFRPVGFYLAKREFILEHKSFLVAGMTQSVIVPAERGIDIDRQSDLWMAEGILRRGRFVTGVSR
jgi:CMP-N,N'-diacetyllegionaminic acid synthase